MTESDRPESDSFFRSSVPLPGRDSNMQMNASLSLTADLRTLRDAVGKAFPTYACDVV